MSETERFLDAVFADTPGGFQLSWIPLSDTSEFKSVYCGTRERVLAKVEELNGETQSIYLRMTTLKQKPKKRGKAEDSYYLPGIWADLDYGSLGHSNQNLPPTAEAAESIITASGLPKPSALINSGGGLYPLWLFDDAVEITDKNRSDLSELLSGWQRQLAAGSKRLGWHYGTEVRDLARVLRIPGSVNRKTDTDRPCVTVWDDGPRYSLERIEQALEDAGLIIEPVSVHVPAERELTDAEIATPPTDQEVQRAGELLRYYADHIAAGTLQMSDGSTAAGRNVACNAALFTLYRFVLGGCLEQDAVTEIIWEASTEADGPLDWDRDEYDAVCRSAWNAAEDKGPQRPKMQDASEFDIIEESRLGDDFWHARPALQQVYAWAKARKASPEATLGYVLVRAVAATPPEVVLPPLIGDDLSLNLFLAVVAKSGGGKGAAARASNVAIRTSQPYTQRSLGSGEGIGHLFVRRATATERNSGAANDDNVIQHSTAVLFDVSEVDSVAALNSRQSSTLMPELRKAWMGERLGFAYADPLKALPIDEHSYRLCLTIGVQPGKGAALLNDAEREGGTPQRFFWMPGNDPDVIRQKVPDPDDPIIYVPPSDWAEPDDNGRIVMSVCDEAISLINEAHADNLAGKTEALDGHALACREKVAAALALLDNRLDISSEDWRLAGRIMKLSNVTRSAVENTLLKKAQEENERRGKAIGHAEVAKIRIVETDRVKKTCTAVLNALRKMDGSASRSQVKNGIWEKHREYLDDAIEALERSGQLSILPAKGGQDGVRLELPKG